LEQSEIIQVAAETKNPQTRDRLNLVICGCPAATIFRGKCRITKLINENSIKFYGEKVGRTH